MSHFRTIIEPHADDAFLSLGGHIEMWQKLGDQVRIVTVYSGTRKRAADAQAYAKAVGATWLGLGASEPDPKGNSARAAMPRLRAVNVLGDLYVPLAFANPEHAHVLSGLDQLGLIPLCFFYLDQPYASTQKHSPAVSMAMATRTVASYLRPPLRKYRHIPLFKDQAKFFYYNPAEKLQHNIELIVR